MHQDTHSDRLEARVAPEVKALLKQAAALERRSLTNFMLTHLQAAARKSIAKSKGKQLILQDREFALFTQSTLDEWNSEEDNEAFKDL